MLEKVKMHKIFVLTVLAISLVLASTSGLGAQKKQITIGSSVIFLAHPFYVEVREGMLEAAGKNNVDITVHDPNLNLASQIAAIEDFVQRRVDAIILYGVDPVAVVPAVEDAKRAGIPVITADMRLQTDVVDTFIGSDNTQGGQMAGEFARKYITEKLDGRANVVIFEWPASTASRQRVEGFKSALAGMKEVKYVAQVDGYGREKAMNAMEDIMQANPDIDLVFGFDGDSALGAYLAAKAAGRDQEMVFIGFDANRENLQVLKDPKSTYIADIAQQPRLIGITAVETALKVLAGEKMPEWIKVPIKVVTKENVNEFLK